MLNFCREADKRGFPAWLAEVVRRVDRATDWGCYWATYWTLDLPWPQWVLWRAWGYAVALDHAEMRPTDDHPF